MPPLSLRLPRRRRAPQTGAIGLAIAQPLQRTQDSVGRRHVVAVSDAQRPAAGSGDGADVAFVAVEEHFDNHGACRTFQRDRYVNDALKGERLRRVMTPDGDVVDEYDDGFFTISASSFHPSQAGYDAYHAVIDVSLATVLKPSE